MLSVLVTILHILVSVVLILVVLLQTGKRADLAGAFGGGGSQTAFGARGASTFFSKLTTTCAVIFMMTSLSLAILSVRTTGGSSVLDDFDAPAQTGAPAPAGTQQDQPPLLPADPGADDPFSSPTGGESNEPSDDPTASDEPGN